MEGHGLTPYAPSSRPDQDCAPQWHERSSAYTRAGHARDLSGRHRRPR